MDSISHQLLVDHWEGKEEVEAYPLVKIITLTLSCKFILGTDNPERIARLVSDFDDVTLGMHSIMLNVPGTIFYKANKAAAAIRKELLLVIKEKEAAGEKLEWTQISKLKREEFGIKELKAVGWDGSDSV